MDYSVGRRRNVSEIKGIYQRCIGCKRVKIRVLRDRLLIGQIKELGNISLGQIKVRKDRSELGKIIRVRRHRSEL